MDNTLLELIIVQSSYKTFHGHGWPWQIFPEIFFCWLCCHVGCDDVYRNAVSSRRAILASCKQEGITAESCYTSATHYSLTLKYHAISREHRSCNKTRSLRDNSFLIDWSLIQWHNESWGLVREVREGEAITQNDFTEALLLWTLPCSAKWDQFWSSVNVEDYYCLTLNS